MTSAPNPSCLRSLPPRAALAGRVSSALVLAWLLVCAVPALSQSRTGETADPPEPSRAELTQDLALRLAAGEDVAGDLAQLKERRAAGWTPAKSATAQLPRSEVAERFESAMTALRRSAAGRAASDGAAESVPQKVLDDLRVADLLVRAHFDDVRAFLEEHEISAEIVSRLDQAEAAHAARVDPLRSSQRWSDLAKALGAAPRRATPRPILRSSTLPYRRPALASRAPQTEPAVVPAYLDAEALPASSTDLAASADAPLTEPILEQAAALGHDYVAIYEFVRGLHREWYHGAMKGAEQTLVQGAGNDIDQASLLISLLRASSVGARYVRGVADVTVESLADDFALADATGVPAALRLAGVPFEPVVQGGRVARVRLETTWVEAYVPYANYRGAVVDTMGHSWIPLAPAFARWHNEPSSGTLDEMGLDRDAFVEEYLQTPRDELPSDVLRQQVLDHLLDTDPTQSWTDQLAVRQQVEERLGLLPSTLPFAVAAITYEGVDLPAASRHEVRFSLRRGAAATDPVVLELRRPVREVAGRRLTISYLPATVDDHRVTNLFGGLSTVPLYLVRVRAQLRIDGQAVATSEESFTMGDAQRLEAQLLLPDGATGPMVDHLVTIGAYAALGVEAQRLEWTPIPENDAADAEYLGARLLARMVRDYSQRWTDSEDLLGRWLDVRVVRPWPALAAVSTLVEVSNLGDLPYRLDLTGVSIDAALRAAEPVSTLGDAGQARHWMRWSALEGSALEHRIFEDGFLIPGISADRVLAVARDAGEEIVELDDPASPDLARLEHPPEVFAAIDDALRFGYRVQVPLRTTAYLDWVGSGWWVEEPSTGEAGYFLSGEIAGGMTAQKPDEWLLDWLAPLGSPYLPEPGHDPLAVTRIEKLELTDLQNGTVGEMFTDAVGVQVFDRTGKPVEGAQVLFEILDGGGGLTLDYNDPETATSTLLVETDYRGLAAAYVVSGERTGRPGLFAKDHPSDEHPQLVLVNRVHASAASYRGLVEIEAPFELLGFPGEPTETVRVDSLGDHYPMTGVYWGVLQFQAVDEFGNSVANVDLRAISSLGTNVGTQCPGSTLPAQRPARLVDPAGSEPGLIDACVEPVPTVDDGCGSDSYTASTDFMGMSIGYIAGTLNHRRQHLNVGPAGDDGGVAALELDFEQNPASIDERDGECFPGTQWLMIRGLTLSPLGYNYSATKAGEFYPVELDLHYFVHPYTSDDPPATQDPSLWSRGWMVHNDILADPPDDGMLMLGNVLEYPPEIRTDDGGSLLDPFIQVPSSPCPNSGGYYSTSLQTSPDSVNHHVWPARFQVVYSDSHCELTFTENFFDTDGASANTKEEDPPGEVAGLSFEAQPILPESGDPLPTNDRGFTTRDLEIEYTITPGNYLAHTLTAVLLDVEHPIAEVEVRDRVAAEGVLVFPRGLKIHRDGRYFVKLVANRGTESEVESEKQPIDIGSELIIEVDWEDSYFDLEGTRSLLISQNVDVQAATSCTTGSDFWFAIRKDAYVTLKFKQIAAIDTGGGMVEGQETIIWEEEFFEKGEHHRLFLPEDLAIGLHTFVLTAEDAEDENNTESFAGSAKVEYNLQDHVPLGHTFVHGVDLFDGRLGLQREDISIPTRVIPLAFRRSYSSGRTDGGPLGVGWSHNWDSKVVKGQCDTYVIQGGDGSGMRFVANNDGTFRSVNGYHGTLVPAPISEGAAGFNFYSKSGIEYHYVPMTDEEEWYLEKVTDPHGKQITLTYGSQSEPPRLDRITGPSGYTLELESQFDNFFTWSGWVIHRVTGPGGFEIEFEYDDWGNLVQSGRALQTELFTYDVEAENWEHRFRMLSAEHQETGRLDEYEYVEHELDGGTVTVPRDAVVKVTRSDGGETIFTFDEDALSTNEPEFLTTVTDGRGFDTDYTMNEFGAVKKIEDPLGHTTEIVWDFEHAQIGEQTDANGVKTSYDYDDHGNVIEETVEKADEETYVRTFTYHPPEAFDPPYMKDRMATSTDRNGHTTTYTYTEDLRGDLWKAEIIVTDAEDEEHDYKIEHSYLDNGDRSSTTDRNGHVTTFEYGVHGLPEVVTRPLVGDTLTEYDDRGRMVKRTDAEDRVTEYEYDDLDRQTLRRLADLPAEWKTDYDDEQRLQTETDSEENATEKYFDTRGRLVRTVDATGAEKVVEYDEEGNMTLESKWFEDETDRIDIEYFYDDAGRLERREEPLGRITHYETDPVGNLLREELIGPSSGGQPFEPRVTEYDYDLLNQRIEEQRTLDASTSVVVAWEFDGQGNKLSETDPRGHETTWEYDELNRLIREDLPLDAGRKLLLDGNGNVLTETTFNVDREGVPIDQVRTFVYDDVNRLKERTDAEGHTTLFEYDDVGNVTKVTDPRGNEIETTYRADDLPEVRTVTGLVGENPEPVDIETRFVYDNMGNLEEERPPSGNIITTEYDELNRPKKKYDTVGDLMAWTYTVRGQVETETDGEGNVTINHYDELDRLYWQELPEDREIRREIDAAGNVTKETNPRGFVTRYEFDRLNRLTKLIDADDFEETYEYDDAGNRTAVVNRRGKRTEEDYDELNRIEEVRQPMGPPITRTWDLVGNLLSEIDKRGIETQYTYDRENRRTKTERAEIVLETVRYDGNGNRASVTDANLHTTTFEYDPRNLLTRINAPLAVITKYQYDESGNRTKETDPEGKVLDREYDDRNRLDAEIRDEDRTEYDYDLNNNLTEIDRPETAPWMRAYDDADRLVSVTDPDGGVTEYEYDENNNLTKQTDAEGKVTEFEYDDLDRLEKKILPDDAEETYDYDENGNQIERIDPNGRTILSTFDDLDRLDTVTFPDVGGVSPTLRTVSYDDNNNITQVTETFSATGGTATSERTYDDFDRLETVSDRWGRVITYGYDNNGNRKSVDGGGVSATYTYDDLNRMTDVLSNVGATEYDYYKNGRLKTVTYPNGSEASYEYDASLRVELIENEHNGALVSKFEYTYDGNGNRLTQIETRTGDPAETTEYNYDGLDRLDSVLYPDQTTTYTYDSVGNRKTETSVSVLDGTTIVDRIYTYNDRHQLETLDDLVDPTKSVIYDYDDNGNQISRTTSAGTTDFTFDVLNRITRIEQAGTLLGSYLYNEAGLRIQKTTAEGTARYLYDDHSVLTRSEGGATSKYFYGPDRLLAVDDPTEGLGFYLTDALDSVTDIVTEAGTLLAAYKYDAWGNYREEMDSEANPFGFTGHEHDDESGLIYVRSKVL